MKSGFFYFLAITPRISVLHISMCSGGYNLPLHPQTSTQTQGLLMVCPPILSQMSIILRMMISEYVFTRVVAERI